MNRFLAFCIPWYGPWPRWWTLFCESCRHNPSIDFLVFTDNPEPPGLPPNIRVRPMSRDAMQGRVRELVHEEYTLRGAHKLCDFRPFFGLLFADHLREYAFWGYCDVDVVFGDLSKAISPEHLREVDVYSPYDRYLVGHCTVLRNTPSINHLCFEIEDYRARALAPGSTFCDELGIAGVLARHPEVRFVRPRDYDEEIAKPFGAIGVSIMGSTHVDRLPPGAHQFRWDRGVASFRRPEGGATEVLYIHFMGIKNRAYWLLHRPGTYGRFAFTPVGFLPFPCPWPSWVRAAFGAAGHLIEGVKRLQAR
ncbi:MAG: hypothetical protein KJT01_12425 [Gemmatimonadetes bacterium]|nr:hypothetical protein [Gemmatimonadota bacterium]